jgi:TolB-like protein
LISGLGAKWGESGGLPLSLNTAVVSHHLDQALNSPLFRNAERQSRFLRFVVDAALQSPPAKIKEFDIAVAVYDRRADYDPRTDPIVRVEAARLRARLREYYEVTPPERVRIDIPKGQYVPQFIPVETTASQTVSDVSILVPPFRSLSPDPNDQSFCGGLTEEVVHKLAQDHRLRVITQSAAAWLEQRERPKPRYLLEASVRRAGVEIRVTLHLMELTCGSTQFSNIYQGTTNDIFATQERLAEEIRGDLSAALHIGKAGGERIH